MKTLQVKLKGHGSSGQNSIDQSYPIYIGTGVLSKSELFQPFIQSKKVMVVTNETVAPLYLQTLRNTIAAAGVKDSNNLFLVLPDGERYKNMDVLNSIFDELLKHNFNRQSLLIALGGGVVGDLTGFAAACYQRGIDFIQVPTTLLAQVDSSVGGKTGVNHALGKNMIGAFHQPMAVFSDTNTLNTLQERQFIAGVAEVIKYGLISDYDFYMWLEENIEKVLALDKTALVYLIEQSCINKANVVQRDEKENNIRAILNLGHTFGHAIETITGYTKWLHGEGVAIGMLMAVEMSRKLGWLVASDVKRIEKLLLKAKLPISLEKDISSNQMVEVMGLDKKVQDNKIRLVLLKSIGEATVTSEFDSKLIYESIETFQK